MFYIEINSEQVLGLWKMWNWNTIRNKFQFCPRKVVKYETFSTVVCVMQNDTKEKIHVVKMKEKMEMD